MESYQGCLTSGFQKPDIYCDALQLLLDEHEPLRNDLDRLYQTASLLAYDPKRLDRMEIAEKLNLQFNSFIKVLQPHSNKEEMYLFQMISKHLGDDGGPIAVMQEEHNHVTRHITLFLQKYSEFTGEEESVRELAYYVSVLFHTLTDHFLKEEEILFPLAENMLTNEEKQFLLQSFGKVKAG
ncbi:MULTISPECIES: hemerythrin domain-containing protein [Bacillaceae]|uniref:Hemerythrin domain-containing protein n=1 Tax=Evansella alkalicola TaxID=745819 RepID=A0ABS6JTE0_9BACI|nr:MULTISPECIES: hemerythrin domain-containing protein [Bacillaceae]MBU9721832.1 hemerythrin domain-containing protein [Bacillus alkalicola]